MDKKMVGRMQQWMQILVICLVFVLRAEAYFVDITYLESAVPKGAVCLDGSPPAYHFDKGVGAGVNNWLVHFEGGGWCNSVETCLARRNTRLGSSKQMTTKMTFSGMFSREAKYNPHFYNWNRVRVRYCDGASFTGDVEAVEGNKLYFRGMRIFTAVIDDLLAKGMSNAKNAMISGCSAGGLASILHCDKFKSLLPAGANVKCLADAGFFINTQAVSGESIIQNFYDGVVSTHGSAKNLPSSCTSRMKPSLCFFPENAASGVQTPLFLVNAAYDSWQIKNIVAPGVADPHGTWHNCKADITKCSSTQLATMHDFRLNFLKKLSGIGSSTNFYINSCYAHCQTGTQETWLRDDSPILGGKTIAAAVGDWYYGRSAFQKIDCPYPCDKTCHNRVFDNDDHSI